MEITLRLAFILLLSVLSVHAQLGDLEIGVGDTGDPAPADGGAVPPPDGGAVPPPDGGAVPPPDDLAVPPPDDLAVPPPDALPDVAADGLADIVGDGLGDGAGGEDVQPRADEGETQGEAVVLQEGEMPPEYRSHDQRGVRIYKDEVKCGTFEDPLMWIRLEGEASVVYSRENYDCKAERMRDVFLFNDVWTQPGCENVIKQVGGLKMFSVELVVQHLPEIRTVGDPIYVITCNYEPTTSSGIVASSKVVEEGDIPKRISRYHNVNDDREVEGILEIQDKHGDPVTNSHLGMYVRLQALMTKIGNQTLSSPVGPVKPDEGYRVLDCIARSGFEEFTILHQGCGTGDIIPKNRGFYTVRTAGEPVVESTSVYFPAFQLPGNPSGEITFSCNFIICDANNTFQCDGASCPGSEYYEAEAGGQGLRRKRSLEAANSSQEVTPMEPNREVLPSASSFPLSMNGPSNRRRTKILKKRRRGKENDPANSGLPPAYNAIPDDLQDLGDDYVGYVDEDPSSPIKSDKGRKAKKADQDSILLTGILPDSAPYLERESDSPWLSLGPIIGLTGLCVILLLTLVCTFLFYRSVLSDLKYIKSGQINRANWYQRASTTSSPATQALGASGASGPDGPVVYPPTTGKLHQPPQYNDHWKQANVREAGVRDPSDYVYYGGQNC